MERELVSAGFELLLDNEFLQRLKHVSFLSTLDYVYGTHKSSSRYDHSIGAAYCALEMSRHLNLESDRATALVAANLLHDAGHAPFSHASEPFLLDYAGRYHNGVLSLHLGSTKGVGSDQRSLQQVLTDAVPKVAETVARLVQKKDTEDPLLDALNRSPLNCDKIEGTNRTLMTLGMNSVEPRELVHCYRRSRGNVGLSRNRYDVVLQFWNLQKEAYWSKIYVVDVFSAEAMLTRVMARLFESGEDMRWFLLGTDAGVLERASEDAISKRIIDRLLLGEYFQSLRCNHLRLFQEFKEAFELGRFQKAQRRSLEVDISRRLGVREDFVISHFSRRRRFYENLGLLYQTTLFDSWDIVPVDVLARALYSKQVSGDFFDVFYLPE